MLVCAVCGGQEFRHRAVIWDRLAADWQLAPDERAAMDRQQGSHCVRCRANFRSIALAAAIAGALGTRAPLAAVLRAEAAQKLRVLEVNPAGMLTPLLKTLPHHRLVEWPEVDMHAMPFEEGSFDLVLHSDTLEHVAQPVRALAECRRVLAPGGSLCFTVPVVPGRLTRGRDGLPPSHHGNAGTAAEDWKVVTEYGADMWTQVIRAGFDQVTIHAFDYPSALAMRARR
jgi:SAM-dependent methyltransferase